MNALEGIGVTAQLFGLILAGYGLYKTWQHGAGGAPFWPTWVRQLSRRVFKRNRAQTDTVSVPASDFWNIHEGSATVQIQFNPEQSTEDSIRDLQNHVNWLRTFVSHLADAQDRTDEALRDTQSKTAEEIVDAIARLRLQRRTEAVKELRPAAYGLFISAAGLLVQAFGMVWS